LVIGFFAGLVSLIIVPFVGFQLPPFNLLVLNSIAAFCFFIATYFYVKVVQLEEISRINLWWNITPICTFLIAWLVIGERLDPQQLFAFALLVSGAVVTSLHAIGKKIVISRALFLMLISCFFYACHDVIVRYISSYIPFSTIYIINAILFCVFSLFFFLSKQFRFEFKEQHILVGYPVSLVAIIIIVALLSRAGIIANLKAISLGPVALVGATEGFQSLFVFIIAILLTLFFPKIIKEEIDKKNILFKIGALILMMSGVVVLSFG
jgi:drug/metabolite transporter (DMT)-like permease